jgi:mRNA interferase HicA
MKRRDLEKKLAEFGWYFDRHGGNHDVWTNGELKNFIPRHNDVSENLARGIVRMA